MDIYGFEASEGFISDVTDKLFPQIEEWKKRPLDEVYPVVFIDAIHYTVRDNNVVRKMAACVMLGDQLQRQAGSPEHPCWRQREHLVLAFGTERIKEPRRKGHSDPLRGRTDGDQESDHGGISPNGISVLSCPSGQKYPQVCHGQGSESLCQESENHLHRAFREGRAGVVGHGIQNMEAEISPFYETMV